MKYGEALGISLKKPCAGLKVEAGAESPEAPPTFNLFSSVAAGAVDGD